MALKDLVSDLSNFNGRSQYDKLDTQIKEGVDFIPNTDAPGFTPKTDLESLYIKANSAVSAKPPGFVPASDGQFSQTWGSNFPTQFKNGFFPIADAVSNYNPPENNSLTFDINQHISSGPTQFIIKPFDKTPLYENAHGNSLLPTPNLFDFKTFRERGRTSETAPFHSSVEAPFTNVSLPNIFSPSGYGVEFGLDGGTNLRDRYKDGSIHIFSDDTKEPIGGRVSMYAILPAPRPTPSQFSSPNIRDEDNISTKPEGFVGTQTSLFLPKEASRIIEGEPLFDAFSNTISDGLNIITLKKEYGKNKKIEDLFKFTGFGRDTFNKVPIGIGDNNVQSFGDFRTIANKGPFKGNTTHPIILRKPGSNWDDVLSDTVPGAIGGVLSGALGVVGLLTRTSVGLADKARVFRFMISSKGISFIAKQFAFQALNPTLESKILQAAGSFLFPTHVERHVGGGRYEDIMPLRTLPNTAKLLLPGAIQSIIPDSGFNEQAKFGFGSRLALQSNPEIIPEVSAYGYTIGGKDLGTSLLFMNPNKYLFPISSAPKSIGPDGRISFLGGPRFAAVDADKATDGYKVGQTHGGVTFNSQTKNGDEIPGGDGDNLIKRHSTFSYEGLKHGNRYERQLMSPSEMNDATFRSKVKTVINTNNLTVRLTGARGTDEPGVAINDRFRGMKINEDIGDVKGFHKVELNPKLGNIKGNVLDSNQDKVNMTPYGASVDGEEININGSIKTKDFIKFRFRDVVNDKYIIFRAILEGISDSISPEFGEEKFIGRPDKVYIYQGTERNVSFNFKIYPKTKQELPVLMEKLNYLVGLCYPSHTEGNRMVTPLMQLTIGDMFKDATGLLGGLTVTVEDATTWEIDEGLQFPHFISAQCEFKYIGDNILDSRGKHYGISWLPDGSNLADRYGENGLGFGDYPTRTLDFTDGLFKDLGQVVKD